MTQDLVPYSQQVIELYRISLTDNIRLTYVVNSSLHKVTIVGDTSEVNDFDLYLNTLASKEVCWDIGNKS